MTLDAYLRKHGISEREFAALVYVSQAQIHRLRKGNTWPSRPLVIRIANATGGLVTANDFAGHGRST